MIKSEIINIYTVKFVGLGWLLEVISTTINILVKKKNYKIRIILLDDFNESYLKDRIKFTLFKNKDQFVKVADNLVDQVEALLCRRCLEYLGLANRAGNVLSGFEKVRAALKSGRTNVLLTARDGASNGRSKVCQGLDELRVITTFSRDELSKAMGIENAVHLALLPGGIRTSLLRELSRFEHCRKTVIK